MGTYHRQGQPLASDKSISHRLQPENRKVYNHRIMRLLSACLVFLAIATTTPQESFDFRARYGQPDVERFAIHQDVTLTAEYGTDGKAIMLEIEPRHPFLHAFFEQQPYMPEATAMDALHEVIPETRGKDLRPTASLQSSCIAFGFSSFEGLLITEVSGCAVGLKSLTVRSQSATLPQTSAELYARYDKPDVERFVVRTDLTLTAEYGPDGQACAMRIESRHALANFLNAPAAPMDEVRAVLDEVVPPETRGKKLGPGERILGECNGAALPTEYENVRINPYYGMCERELKVRGVEVRFKRPACEILQPKRIPKP